MSPAERTARWRVLAAALPLLLAACFLLPGKFVSSLDVKADGRFTFAYKGEIVVFNPQGMDGPPVVEKDDPAKPCLGAAPASSGAAPPAPMTIFDPARTHPCTAKERADRTAQVARDNLAAAERRRKEGEQMAKLIGLDPTDDGSMRNYAAQLQKQAGWRSAVYRGKGVFDVDFEQTGMLDRDFVFPVLPKASTLLPFVVIRKRADGAVLVSAPGFHANPLTSLANGLRGGAATGDTTLPNGLQGSFAVTTDTAPLTNNTDDGPTRDGSRTVLRWNVGAASDKVPEALLPIAISR